MDDFPFDKKNLFRILHDQWHGLRALIEAQINILKYLGDDPFENLNFGDESYEENDLITILIPPSKQLDKALKRMINEHSVTFENRNIPLANWEKIIFLSSDFSKLISDNIASPFRYRELASKILSEIDYLKSLTPQPSFHKSDLRDVITKAKEIERLASLYDMHRSIEMSKDANSNLFDFIQSFKSNSITEENINELCNIKGVIKETYRKYQRMAELKGINVNISNNAERIYVKVPKIELFKAIENLLENAIKYTGKLPPNTEHEAPWIKISVNADKSFVFVSFESWGIPVTKDEQLGEFIFKQGYRGYYARQSGIEGTGTGLSFAKEFAIKCGGDITFESNPVERGVKTVPNATTTVTIKLPIAT